METINKYIKTHISNIKKFNKKYSDLKAFNNNDMKGEKQNE